MHRFRRKHRAPRLCCRRSRGCEECVHEFDGGAIALSNAYGLPDFKKPVRKNSPAGSAAVDCLEHLAYPCRSIHFSFGKQSERLICPGRVEQPCMFQASGQVEIVSASLRRPDNHIGHIEIDDLTERRPALDKVCALDRDVVLWKGYEIRALCVYREECDIHLAATDGLEGKTGVDEADELDGHVQLRRQRHRNRYRHALK